MKNKLGIKHLAMQAMKFVLLLQLCSLEPCAQKLLPVH